MKYVMWKSPKTGSSSVGKALHNDGAFSVDKYASGEQFIRALEEGSLPTDRDLLINGRRLKQVCDAGLVRQLPRYGLQIGMARNPFSRFISGWLYARRKGFIPPDTRPIDVATKYTENKPEGWATTKRWRKWNGTWFHCCRQPMWTLYDRAGRLVMDMVLRQESLQSDFDAFRDRIGRPRRVLPHKKRSPSDKPWREWYAESPGLREAVTDLHAPSLEAMGYVFEQDEAVHDCLPQISPWDDPVPSLPDDRNW